jgi:putative restriction endonuclease
MTRDELLNRLARLRRASIGQVRAPHKPLLPLWLFGQFAATGTSQTTYQHAWNVTSGTCATRPDKR